MAKSRIYQIYYDDETRKAVDPAFIPLDNTANERPDWREYWPMRTFLLANTLEPDTFYGFLSPRFCTKANIPASEVNAFIEKVGEGCDLVSFSPFPDQNGLFINVFEQGDYVHPGLAACCQSLLAMIGSSLKIQDVTMDTRNAVFCNYFVAKPHFWTHWLDIGEKLFAAAETTASPLYSQLNSNLAWRQGMSGVDTKVFVMERIVSMVLALHPEMRTAAYEPFKRPVTMTPFAEFPFEAVLSDALKMAYNVSKDPIYLAAFGQIREQVQKQMQDLEATKAAG